VAFEERRRIGFLDGQMLFSPAVSTVPVAKIDMDAGDPFPGFPGPGYGPAEQSPPQKAWQNAKYLAKSRNTNGKMLVVQKNRVYRESAVGRRLFSVCVCS
jgi:hypothetical protein